MDENLKNAECAVCGCIFGVPIALHEAAKHSSNIIFYCPFGHGLHFTEKNVKENKQKENIQEKKDNVVQLRVVKNDES